MQAHIRRELNRLERETRASNNEEARDFDQAQRAERLAEDAYIARAIASSRAGEPEEVFEMREASAMAESHRVTSRANAEICAIFAAAAPRSTERRAA